MRSTRENLTKRGISTASTTHDDRDSMEPPQHYSLPTSDVEKNLPRADRSSNVRNNSRFVSPKERANFNARLEERRKQRRGQRTRRRKLLNQQRRKREEFEKLYTQYESEGRYIKQIDAQKIWMKILEAQIETGTPYMLYKDSINEKSNQKNIGTIKSSNLCCEIVEFTSPDEIAVCNLVSICLPMFVEYDEEKTCNVFNFNELHKVSKIVCKNLNKVIDVNFYPTPKTKVSNMRHRPIGLGVQGLADVFFKMNMAFSSEDAKTLNKHKKRSHKPYNRQGRKQ